MVKRLRMERAWMWREMKRYRIAWHEQLGTRGWQFLN